MCCIFSYCTKMNTFCIFSHDCPNISTAQRSVPSTEMTDDHKVVNRRRSVNSMHLLNSLYTTCIHVVQRSAVLADTASECENNISVPSKQLCYPQYFITTKPTLLSTIFQYHQNYIDIHNISLPSKQHCYPQYFSIFNCCPSNHPMIL